MRRPATALSTALVALALGGAPAGAQDPGVTIDPGAPATKEYEIPLEGARREAAGGEQRLGPQRQGERSAPLFGEGVGEDGGAAPARGSATVPAGTAGAARGAGRPGASGAGARRERTGPTATGDSTTQARTEERREVLQQSPAPDGGAGGGALTIGALAFAVLVLGGVLGSIARRRPAS